MYLRIFKTKVLILNTAKSALDLLETRSAIYSDRPPRGIGGKRADVFAMSTQNPRFKIYRRVLHTGLNPRAVRDYNPIQMQETHTLLKSLLQSPEHFFAHVRRCPISCILVLLTYVLSHRNAAAQIMKISYGYQVESDDDEFIRMIEDGFKMGATILSHGFWVWVGLIPLSKSTSYLHCIQLNFAMLVRFMPNWFPGTGHYRLVRDFAHQLTQIDQVPYEWAKRNIVSRHECI